MSSQRVARLGSASARRIVAGQAVLDPAAVVKELVENALDAGALKVEIRLRGPAGAKSMSVADNGAGIADTSDAALRALVARHSTSKLRGFDTVRDGAMNTFGFRGEALAHVAELSESLQITTRSEDASTGTTFFCDHNGDVTGREPAPRSVGTTVVVNGLFARYPVRRHEAAANARRDMSRVVSTVQALAIAHPRVRFTLTADAGCVVSTAPPPSRSATQSNVPAMTAAVVSLFGNRQASLLRPVTGVLAIPGWTICGLVGGARSSGDRQFFSIRGRIVELPRLARALTEAHRQSLTPAAATAAPPSTFPVIAIALDCPDRTCDFNCSTDKRQVFILDEQQVVASVVDACDNAGVWSGTGVRQLDDKQRSQEHVIPVQGRLLIGPDASILTSAQAAADACRKRITDATSAADSAKARLAQIQSLGSRRGTPIPNEPGSLPTVHERPKTTSHRTNEVVEPPTDACRKRNAEATSSADSTKARLAQVQSPGSRRGTAIPVKSDDRPSVRERPKTSSGTNESVELPREISQSSSEKRILALQAIGRTANDRQSEGIEASSRAGLQTDNLPYRRNGGAQTPESAALGTSPTSEEQLGRPLTPGALTSSSASALTGCPSPRQGEKTNRPDGVRTRSDIALDRSGGVSLPPSAQDAGARQFSQPRSRSANRDVCHIGGNGLGSTSVAEFITSKRRRLRCGDASAIERREHQPTSLSEIPQSIARDSRDNAENDAQMDRSLDPELLINARLDAPPNQEVIPTETVQAERPAFTYNAAEILEFWNEDGQARRSTPSCEYNPHTRKYEACSFESGLDNDLAKAEEELVRVFRKQWFREMEILGQFNLGFVVCRLGNDLFIVDQHAADEKFNFEDLQRNGHMQVQKLLVPLVLELSGTEEALVQEHLGAFKAGGFEFEIRKDAPPTQRVALASIPFTKNILFGISDVQEMLARLRNDSPEPHGYPKGNIRRMRFECMP